MNTRFRARLNRGELLIGTLITLPASEVAEIMAEIGFDWLFVDTEHSSLDARGAQAILQAAGNRCPCVIRVPSNDEVWIKKALDVGAAGIIAPQVNSAYEAARVARCCKYPPEGSRGVGMARAHTYGIRFQEYVEEANEQIAVIIQAEQIEGVENIQSIVKVPGIDAIFIGPYDLSASLGKAGNVSAPEVQKAIEQVRACCLTSGIRLGIFGANAEAVSPFIEQGYTLIAVGTDALFMGKTARETLSDLRR